MHYLRLACASERKDDLITLLWEAGTSGVVESDLPANRTELKAYFAQPFQAGPEYESFEPHWHEEPDIDWVAETHAAWPPLLVGKRWFIAPPWNNDPVPEGRIRLQINPGIAFGTGADLTTQLCLEAIETELRPSDSVLDFGTGSGILALAAFRLGARLVTACDIDADALRVAREDLPPEIPLFVGSIRSVRDQSIDLLLANLNAETIASHAAEFRRVLRTDGRVIISGVPPRHGERVVKALTSHGLPPREVLERDIWLRIVC